MIHFIFLVSRQGVVRLSKFYTSEYSRKQQNQNLHEVSTKILSRSANLSNILEWKGLKIVYKRYASLFFVFCTDRVDNELVTLEQIHCFVEVLDRYFGNVCELDLIFNFHKAYFLLDELFLSGEQQETSKMQVLQATAEQDILTEEGYEHVPSLSLATRIQRAVAKI